ncbi:sulfite/nitrite reductase [Clostridium beijerinckii]|uniref:4Fe-4S binding protein n=1 Tax=Clostridium beijerinckii TaxID=1520 RepID=A0AB74VAA5_CLOBE|nr:4Fe-4S binding protein [Clostridium beijerinckii]OOM26069.1 anaerobic sulfite reductase subunit C [Clostridium beijerinckii]QUN33349.1 4Fe-4S binding protein [Clostridium beijerinckii]GEP63811.1 sulfite/nitrite reductase [Clostridium beijerinckii]SQB20007.1 nitrite and sulfite reductase 4Fe-4S subunit [Clostridium beijerinckii]
MIIMVNEKRQKEMKALGFLLQNDREHYAVRFLSRAGNFTVEELNNINGIAKKYGRGYSGLTTRLQIEVPWIKDEDAEKVMEEAKSFGLRHGGTGQKIRPLVACKGTVCLHGNIDTQAICRELEEKYFATDTPHKCKIGIVGCANNCAKANINDIGIMGKTIPEFNLDNCVGCGICVKGCRQKALEVVNRKVVYHEELCVSCGECSRLCRTNAVGIKEKGAEIFVGGRFGRGIRIGDSLGKIFKEKDIVFVVDKIMECYREIGVKGERISTVMDRVGKEKFISEVLSRQ